MCKKHIMLCEDQESYRIEFIKNYKKYYKISVVTDINNLIEELYKKKKQKDFPDLLLLDLYHPKYEGTNIKKQIDSVTALDKKIKSTNKIFGNILLPKGLEILKNLRTRKAFRYGKLPIAIYTKKGLALLDEKEIISADKHNAHWIIKENNEKSRIDQIIYTEKTNRIRNNIFRWSLLIVYLIVLFVTLYLLNDHTLPERQQVLIILASTIITNLATNIIMKFLEEIY